MATLRTQDRITSPTDDGKFSPSPSMSTTYAPRSNALQNKITNVLSASYADLEIRDALSILDQRSVQNSADSRRNLRLDLQLELVECNASIIRDFGHVAAQLQRVGAAIDSLNANCAQLHKHVVAANRETAPMLDEAKTLLSEQEKVQTRLELLSACREHFVLTDAEVNTLTSTTQPVDDGFFRALSRMKNIHQDCQVLLGSENQRLGLEILDQSTRQLDAAFQKLYRWIQREFKTLDLENPQINTAIRRALRVLAERPRLFQTCMDFFAEGRERILSNNFYAALTGTPLERGHPILGKAIELSAHDPLRYVSDMFAWAHSAGVSEKEALEGLFIMDGEEIAKSIKTSIENQPWSFQSEDEETPVVFDGRKALNQLVDRDLAGVFRQLKQRTEQVIQSHEDATLAYKVANLVAFYDSIFVSLLGEHSALQDLLRPLSDDAMRTFRAIMHEHVVNLVSEVPAGIDDCSPPGFLLNALETLEDLMKSFDTSMLVTDRIKRAELFRPVLQEALDPFLAACETYANHLKTPNEHIFAHNCLVVTKAVLHKFAFADRTDELQPKLEYHEDELARATHLWFLEKSGMKAMVESTTRPEHFTPSYNDPSQLAAIASRLDAFLPTATEEARASLGKLQSKPSLRRIIETAAEMFCDSFEEIETLIVKADEIRMNQTVSEEDSEIELREVFPRTVDEIRVLLS